MATPNRAALIAKAHKVLKQNYKPPAHDGQRSLMEHLLFACCLENAHHDVGEKVYGQLSHSFIDWNEVRVSTVGELAETMRALPDATSAASNLKRILNDVFESIYSFDLESLKKKNISEGIKRLGKIAGASPFIVAYTTQLALGGHSIPLDRGALEALSIVGIATDSEVKSATVAGLERTIPKNKGIEFGSLLHEFGADLVSNPYSAEVRKILLAINPDAKDRLPKRPPPKKEPVPEPAKPEPTGKRKPTSEKGAADKSPEKGAPEKAGEKGATDKVASHKSATAKEALEKGAAAKSAHEKSAPEKHVEKRTPAKPAADSKHARPAKPRPPAPAAKKKSSTKQLAKRKPR